MITGLRISMHIHANLATRWHDYHGAADWRGLLDPLDPALRSELLRYGRFARTAYTAFGSSPSSLKSMLTSTGYVPTRHLFSSSTVQLPGWLERLPGWVVEPTTWAGYVAVCEDEEEIARFGRRDVVIAYRGTATCPEWVENLRIGLTRVRCPFNEPADIMVHTGFWSLYTSKGLGRRSLQEQVRDEVNRLVEMHGGREPLSITVTGHSLGAALAILTAYDIAFILPRRRRPRVAAISFGGPRVANAKFRRRVEQKGVKVLRIVNPRDIVTKVPGFATDDVDGGFLRWFHMARLSYSDVGEELRVICESGCAVECHDLDVYLQLGDNLAPNPTEIHPPMSLMCRCKFHPPKLRNKVNP